ncbi:MAG: cation:proton antiporter, partial [Candidatus Altiarchaeota archaeon]|nr:cation:proton antiporter [Candidatus Altiarchaeota archaeon]
WILLIAKVFKQYRSYMLTIAYLILIYVVTEFLGGNGTIAALFFGLVLGNSKKLTSLVGEIILRETEKRNILKPKKDGITVVSNTEMFFYSQISFFLKTFFFVYVGLLLNTSDTVSIAIGLGIAIAIMVMRYSSLFITRAYMEFDRSLISSTFARGLAAAVIAQEVVLNKIPNAEMIANITYSVIVFTIILSSINIFLVRGFAYKEPEKEVSPTAPQQE